MTEIQKVNVATTTAAQKAEQAKEAKTQEVQTAEAKALEEAKTNENTNVSVDIAEETPQQEEKQGFFSKLWSGIKSFFSGEGFGKVSKTVGGAVLGGGLGGLIFGPIGAFAGIILGTCGGAGVFNKSESQALAANTDEVAAEETEETEEAEEVAEATPEKANTTEETVDADGNKVVTTYDENGEATVKKYDPEGNEIEVA